MKTVGTYRQADAMLLYCKCKTIEDIDVMIKVVSAPAILDNGVLYIHPSVEETIMKKIGDFIKTGTCELS